MENRTQTRLTIIAALLVIVLGIVIVKENLPQLKTSTSISSQFNITKNEINHIDIIYKNAHVTLEKAKNMWMVTKPKKGKANQARVDATLTELLSLATDNVISTNKSKQKTLGIGDDKIVLQTPSHKATIYIGLTDLNETNITFDGDINTYAVNDISHTVNPIEYRDLTVSTISNMQDVNALDITYGSNEIHLAKKNDSWTANEIPAKNDRIISLLNDLKSLTASDIGPATPQTAEASINIEIREKKQVKTLTFFETDTGYNLITTGSKDMYTINKIYADNFKKSIEDLTQ